MTVLLPVLATAIMSTATIQNPSSQPDQTTITVTGHRLQAYRDALAACLARNCPTNEDVDASLALAEAQFVEGEYDEARFTVARALRRNRDAAGAFPEPVSDLYRAQGGSCAISASTPRRSARRATSSTLCRKAFRPRTIATSRRGWKSAWRSCRPAASTRPVPSSRISPASRGAPAARTSPSSRSCAACFIPTWPIRAAERCASSSGWRNRRVPTTACARSAPASYCRASIATRAGLPTRTPWSRASRSAPAGRGGSSTNPTIGSACSRSCR